MQHLKNSSKSFEQITQQTGNEAWNVFWRRTPSFAYIHRFFFLITQKNVFISMYIYIYIYLFTYLRINECALVISIFRLHLKKKTIIKIKF